MRRRRGSALQVSLPGVERIERQGRSEIERERINHARILRQLQANTEGRRGILEIYRSDVLPVKTRTLNLLGRKCQAVIIHTLLGFEVKASYKRIHCPDLVTARYLKLFTELGCRSIKLPYDPTVTGRLMPELEVAFERLLSGIRQQFAKNRSLQLYVERRVFRLLRRQVQHA